MKDSLYHCEVYWNENIQHQIEKALSSELPLIFDSHAIDNKFERKISISRITIKKLSLGYCFEAKVYKNKVVKFVIRYGYDDIYDLCSVWIPKSDCLYCKTIWLNKKDDKHYTLDEKKYVSYDNNKNNSKHISVCLGDLINRQINNK